MLAPLNVKPIYLGLGETIFDTGFNTSAMQSAVQNLAENSMDTLNELNAHRHDIARTYEEAFQDEGVIPIPEGGSAVYTRFPLMAGSTPIPKGLKRLGVRRMYPKAIANVETIRRHLADDSVSVRYSTELCRHLP